MCIIISTQSKEYYTSSATYLTNIFKIFKTGSIKIIERSADQTTTRTKVFTKDHKAFLIISFPLAGLFSVTLLVFHLTFPHQ
jgi:hypothetical protein